MGQRLRPGPGSLSTHDTYLYGVQGLRTVAALMVAVYHIWFHRVSGGVDVFFVVAGYFAAGSLLKVTGLPTSRERLRGVVHYFLRTARRVIPSAFVVIVGTVAAGIFLAPRSQWQAAIEHGWASLQFWENWHLMQTGKDYLSQSLTDSPFQQFWALSIQVQFYVLFPLMALLAAALARLTRGSQRRLLFVVAGVVLLASLAFSVLLTETDQPLAYFHLGTRLWEFAAGTVLALILSKHTGNRVVMRLLGWAGLLTIVSFAAFVDPSPLLPGFAALIPVTAAAAVIAAARHGVEPGILKSRPLVWFADSSFAFYLWHWPLLVIYRYQFQETVSLRDGLAILVLAAILAIVTTTLVEKPIRTARRLRESMVASIIVCSLLLGTAAAALVYWDSLETSQREGDVAQSLGAGDPPVKRNFVPSSAVARQDVSAAYERECQQSPGTAEVISCKWGDKSSTTTIALVGASHSTQWIDQVAATAEEQGVKLVSMTKGSCPFGDMTEVDFAVDSSCIAWMDDVMNQLLADPPEVLITVATRPVDGVEEVPEWKLPHLKRLSAAGITVLGIRDNPRFGFDVPACIDAKGIDACAVRRSDVLRPLDELEIPDLLHFTFVDTAADYCREDVCLPVTDGVLMSADGSHLTRTWTMVNGGTIRDAIIGALEG